MPIRWLMRKIFKDKAPRMVWLSYLPPCIGILLCYQNLSGHRSGDMTADIVSLCLLSAMMLVAIGISLRRFSITLQKPYHSANLHVALGSVVATIVFFAAVYSIIYEYVPNSFVGLSGDSALTECVNVIYFSATTFTTLGFGDVHPVHPIAKVFVSIETMSFFVFFVVLLGNNAAFVKPKSAEARRMAEESAEERSELK